ncbi:hypothetical protein ACFUEN_28935 [Streptomyces griseorubiginosus]|uniref:hypothetical protein n=1 Tax=Streptomyces griseorubiginosus TaxID=67304 RepID=UPI00362854DB
MPDELMQHLLRSGVLAAPHQLDPPHPCCWMVGEEACGLWCGHDGEHLPYAVGAYLPPPTISPLWILRFQQQHAAGAWLMWQCPLCGARPAPDFGVDRGPDTEVHRVWEDQKQVTYELTWRFEPCGCEGRELLPIESLP